MIREVTMYEAVCDNCNKTWENDHYGWVCMSDESSLHEMIDNDDWHIGDGIEGEDGKIYCPNCFEYDDDDNFQLKSNPPTP